jgi:hypothetical protein
MTRREPRPGADLAREQLALGLSCSARRGAAVGAAGRKEPLLHQTRSLQPLAGGWLQIAMGESHRARNSGWRAAGELGRRNRDHDDLGVSRVGQVSTGRDRTVGHRGHAKVPQRRDDYVPHPRRTLAENRQRYFWSRIKRRKVRTC